MRDLRRVVLAGLLASLTRPAAAAEPPETSPEPAASSRGEYSQYEEETIAEVVERAGAEIEPAPEGKVIESIEVVALEVIGPRDPAPQVLNWLHTTTREEVVLREILLRPGVPYDERLIRESERKLRAFRQLSLVLIVPVRGSTDDRVRLLAITKDVWSLRVNWDLRVTGDLDELRLDLDGSRFPLVVRVTDGRLEHLVLQPSEENLFGRHNTVAVQYLLRPDTHSFGGRFFDRRIAGSTLRTLVDANVIVNRETGSAEGSFGALQFGNPLFWTQSKWAWDTLVTWRREVTRRFRGLERVLFEQSLPFEYDTDTLFWQTSVTRSYGKTDKTDLTAGVEARRRAFDVERLSAFDAALVRRFADQQVPVSDTRIGPFVQLDAYSTDFIRTLDVNTLGLQEDYEIGHRVFLKAYTGAQAAQSSRDLLGVAAGAAYTLPLGDGLARLWGTNRIELTPSAADSDAQVETGLRLITPPAGFARLVYDGALLHRYRNYLNPRLTLGGDTRLRGYRSGAFFGSDAIASNLELRTRPVQLMTVQLGAVAFYDAGDAFDGFSDLDIKHGAGFGLRAVFPQVERLVARLDVAFPLSRVRPEESAGPVSVVLTFGHAFSMPQISPLSPVLATP